MHVDKRDAGKSTDYIHGAQGTLARITNNAVTYLHHDRLGSAQTGTNSSGAILWQEAYTPYGEALNDVSANQDLAGFTGHIKDDATGLSYMQARYYDPIIGRFYSNDPIGFRDVHSFNRYAYANNNPHKYIDPDGRQSYVAYMWTKSIEKQCGSDTDCGKEKAKQIATGVKDAVSLTSAGLAFDFVEVSMSIANGDPVGDKLISIGAGELISKGVESSLKGKLGKGLTELIGNAVGEQVESSVERTLNNITEKHADTDTPIMDGVMIYRVEGRLDSNKLAEELDN